MNQNQVNEMMAAAGMTPEQVIKMGFDYGNLAAHLYLYAIVSASDNVAKNTLLGRIESAIEVARKDAQVVKLHFDGDPHLPQGAKGIVLWMGIVQNDKVPKFTYHESHEEHIHSAINMLLSSVSICWKYPSVNFSDLLSQASRIIPDIKMDLDQTNIYLCKKNCPQKISVLLAYYDSNSNLLAVSDE